MDDLDLDREVRATMAALPSPEFVARVRANVADAPPPSIVPGWLKPAAAIACAAAVAIVVGMPREDARLKPSPTEVTAGLKPSTTYVLPVDTQVLPTTKAIVVPTLRSAKPAIPPSQPAEPPLPEVMVAAEDVEALWRFLSAAHNLQFVASFDETPASTAWVITELTIAPIGGDALNARPSQNN